MSWRDHPIVAFDTETTGLEPFAGDRVIEFAAVVFRVDSQGRVTDRTAHAWLIDPQAPIPRKVTEITGISDSDVAGKPTFQELAPTIRSLLQDAITVAHNYPFDLAFLTQELRRAGLWWPEPLAEVDTVDLSLRCFPEARSHKLGDLAERLGIRLEGAHRATNDAEACGLAFLELAGRHQVTDDLQQMLDWAKAIGRPPDTGPLAADPETGRIVFREGPLAGRPAAEHPLQLAWMEKARVREAQGWAWRYDEPTRRWVRRWLDVRGAGRARGTPKSFRSEDWVLDSCILPAKGTP